MLKDNFDVEVHRAHSFDEAVKMALDTPFDLVMINRLLDADGTPGKDILTKLKTLPSTAEVPVMIVSNFEDAQQDAVKLGAVPGFGKAAIDAPETLSTLEKLIG